MYALSTNSDFLIYRSKVNASVIFFYTHTRDFRVRTASHYRKDTMYIYPRIRKQKRNKKLKEKKEITLDDQSEHEKGKSTRC